MRVNVCFDASFEHSRYRIWLRGSIQFRQREYNFGNLFLVDEACLWWPNIEFWLGTVRFYRDYATVLLRNPIVLLFFRGRGRCGPLSPILDPGMCRLYLEA